MRGFLFTLWCLGSCGLALAGNPSVQGRSPAAPSRAIAPEDLVQGFVKPPDSAKPWVYWWWLNGYVSREGIVRDLDAMRNNGIGGALVFHAGHGRTPGTTVFMSRPWRDYFRFAVEQAAKRGITIGLNLCGGWNAGGPWVTPADAAKELVYETIDLKGPKVFDAAIPKPAKANDPYQDIAVLAWPVGPNQTLQSRAMLDLTDKLDAQGRLRWTVPQGPWCVVRFGWRLCPKGRTKCTGGKSYLEIDPLNADAMDRHFAATAGVVIQDVMPYVGKTFKYLHIDSGEIGHPDWTGRFRAQFKRLRGYDPFAYLAVRAGRIVDNAQVSERFDEDYQRTIGDLMIACYYGRLGALARPLGLGTHSEAAGYQKPTVDALRALGCNDICMSEFWSRRSQAKPYIHQLAAVQLAYHDGIRNAASAAHVYGRKIVQAEAFTVIRNTNYDRAPFDLKDIGDRAFCAGLNRAVLHQYMCQADEQAMPGYVWPGIGTEFDRHATWWPMGSAWLTYLSRCQYLLQAGRFVGDVCYLQSEQVPVYVRARWAMDPALPPGYNCDTINADALIRRATAGKDGRLVLPGGQSYRYLVLWQGGRWQRPARNIFWMEAMDMARPESPAAGSGKPLVLAPATWRKLKQLVEAGVTVIGPRPVRSVGLADYPNCDAEVKKVADALWGDRPGTAGRRTVGRGRVIWGRSLAEIFREDGLAPDVAIHESPATQTLPPQTLCGIPHPGTFDWIHRKIGGADVYFIANLRNAPAAGRFIFRTAAKQPELWNAVTGEIQNASAFQQTTDGRTAMPLALPPRGSIFVVFRKAILPTRNGSARTHRPKRSSIMPISGPWVVRFDPKWGGPRSVVFEKLEDWTRRPEAGIRYYSGTATYNITFDLPEAWRQGKPRVYLDLGKVNNIAAVRLNGKALGVAWTAPWQVQITSAMQPTGNRLEIDVANLWANRLIGDAALPPDRRRTTTNVTSFKNSSPLRPSGLLGPVRLEMVEVP